MIEDLLKDGYDYEDYTENFMQEKKSCCKTDSSDGNATCGCKSKAIPIKK